MSSDSVPSRSIWLLFLVTLSFHLLGNWALPLIDRDEPRFAEASREMLERQDYVVPYFNNEYRFDKPPLTYWLQSTAYRVLGENEFAARLPSALAAAGIAVVLLLWGRRLFDVAAGWRAAIIFSLSLQVVMHARAAVADMLLVFFVSLAVWAGWEMCRAENSRRMSSRWWWLFFVGLGFGFLAKGPIAWLPLIPYAAFLLRSEGKKCWGGFFAGLILMLGITAAWGIPALLATHGEFFKVGIGKHVVGRSVATMEGHGLGGGLLGYVATLPFYFIAVWLSLAPWCVRLPSLVKNFRITWQQPDTKYLWSQALLVFLVFSLVKTKLPHYTLPAFPMLALLIAREIDPLRFRRIAMGMTIAVLALTLIIFPLAAPQFPAWNFCRMSHAVLKPEMEFASSEFEEPSLVWTFRKYVHGFHSKVSPIKAAKYMARTGPRFYILPTTDYSQAFPNPDPLWKTFRHQGWNVAKGKPVDLTMVVKTN